MFLVIITYKQTLMIVDQHLAAHRAFLAEGYKNDYFIVSGPRNPRTGGILLSQLHDRQQLEKILQQDPYYINAVADYEIIEFTPALFHDNFRQFIAKPSAIHSVWFPKKQASRWISSADWKRPILLTLRECSISDEPTNRRLSAMRRAFFY